MKKVLSLFAGMALSVSAFAQLAPGSTAPNWTFTDLNGNSWTLYSLTAQGQTVFIDVSATWCAPCWNYHNTHALRDIYDEYGPAGTIVPNQIMVFYIEGDAATTIADLNGTGSNTQGNWVTGTTYPIIDPGSATTQFNNDYNIGYFPTIYKVCPDNKIYEVGQMNSQGLLNTIGSCPSTTADAYATAGPVSLNCVSTFAPTITLKNNAMTGNLTSCDITYAYDGGGSAVLNWTGTLAPGATTAVSLPSQTFTAGSHYVDVTVDNANSGGDGNIFNNDGTYNFSVNTANATATPYTNNMSSSSFPYNNWIVENPDGDYTWERGTTNGGSLWMDCYSYGNVGAVDEFIMEPVDLSALSTASVQFNVAHKIYSSAYNDALEVLVSSDCGVTWSSVWSKSGSTLATVPGNSGNVAFVPTVSQWRAECINLNAYAGQSKVFVKFRCINGYGNNIYVDDINVSNATCTIGIDEVADATSVNVYPNPANSSVNLAFQLADKEEVTVNVYNTLGEIVYSENKGEMIGTQIVTINTENFTNGMYMVELVAGETKTVTRMNVSH